MKSGNCFFWRERNWNAFVWLQDFVFNSSQPPASVAFRKVITCMAAQWWVVYNGRSISWHWDREASQCCSSGTSYFPLLEVTPGVCWPAFSMVLLRNTGARWEPCAHGGEGSPACIHLARTTLGSALLLVLKESRKEQRVVIFQNSVSTCQRIWS